MFDLFGDIELRKYVQENVIQSAATWGAILELLTKKGIITPEEFKEERLRCLAAVEQEFEAMKEEARSK